MKRFYSLLLLSLAVLVGSSSVMAQQVYSEKQRNAFAKEAEKEAKKAAKELRKEKWLFNGVGTLEKAYERYLLATKNYGGVGEGQSYTVDNAPNMTNGEKSLMNMAQSAYAQENEAYLKLEQANHSGEVAVTIEDNVVKALAQFNGDVKRSFIVYKKNGNGRYDMRGFFIIDGDQTRAKLRKLAKDLSDETDLAKKIKESAGADE